MVEAFGVVDDLTHQEIAVPAGQFTARMPVRPTMSLQSDWSPDRLILLQ
jgi:hypothetical protein